MQNEIYVSFSFLPRNYLPKNHFLNSWNKFLPSIRIVKSFLVHHLNSSEITAWRTINYGPLFMVHKLEYAFRRSFGPNSAWGSRDDDHREDASHFIIFDAIDDVF